MEEVNIVSVYETIIAPNLDNIAKWTEEGLSKQKIAEKLGIGYSTFKRYASNDKALKATIKKSACIRDEAVENALYKRAVGEYVKVKRPVKVKKSEYDPQTGKKIKEWEEVVTAEEEQYIPPDTGANIFWCVNHMGDRYKNNPHQVKINEKKLKIAENKAKKDDW